MLLGIHLMLRCVLVSQGLHLITPENILAFVLIIVQRDATQNSLFIILQVHSTCFGCQPHPSLVVHKTVTTAFCTYLPPTWPTGHFGGR